MQQFFIRPGIVFSLTPCGVIQKINLASRPILDSRIFIFQFLDLVVIDDDASADQSDLFQQADHPVYCGKAYTGVLLPCPAADLLDRRTLFAQDHIQYLASLVGDPAAFPAQSADDHLPGDLIRFNSLIFCLICIHALLFCLYLLQSGNGAG